MEYECRINELSWQKLYEYLLEYRGLHLNNEPKIRQFVEAVYWILKSGSAWRMLPKEYGNWNHVYQRFAAWCDKGIWYKLLYFFAKDADMEYIMVDSTILRAHACAAGAKKRMEKL
jgi:putative transposase